MLEDCHGGEWLWWFCVIAVMLEWCLLNAVMLDDVGCAPRSRLPEPHRDVRCPTVPTLVERRHSVCYSRMPPAADLVNELTKVISL